MTDSTSLWGVASALLVQAASILDTTPAKAPAIQFVSHGPPPFDCCGMLAVAVGQITYEPVARGAPPYRTPDPKMGVVNRVPLTVYALRCATAVPEGGIQITLPQAQKMSADAQATYSDAWALWCGLRNRHHAGTLFPGYPCRVYDVDLGQPIAPDGGCIGWSVAVHVDLDGYSP